MPSKSFGLEDLGKVWTGTLKQLDAEAHKGLLEAAYRGAKQVVTEIRETKPFAPIDQGSLIRSFVVQKTPEGAKLESRAPHAAHQEHGTKPFTAPLAILIEWGVRKARGGAGKTRAKVGKKGKKQAATRQDGHSQSSETEEQRARREKREQAKIEAGKRLGRRAWMSIRKRGIIPKGFFARASKHFDHFVTQAIHRRWLMVR